MLNTERLKVMVNERLKAAAEEIFGLFERAIKDYEEEVSRSKHELERQGRLLTELRVPLQLSADEEKVVSKQQCKQERRHDLDLEGPEPPPIKEEPEELWASEVGEQQLEENKDSMFNIIYVKKCNENVRKSPYQNQGIENMEADAVPSTSAEQVKTEQDGKALSEPTSDCQTSSSHHSASENDDSDEDWRCSGALQSDTNTEKAQQAVEAGVKPYRCSICSKNFKIKSILTRHMKTHTGEKQHTCNVCGKRFIQRSYLQTHMNSHLGQKPYTCRFCGRGFTQVGNMNAHMRIHTGEKPHSCTECGKSFREKADLIKHTIIHTGEKPYSCNICSMKFNAQSNLTRHMKTHSGERPYSCTTCGKRFIRRSHLNIHMKTHEGEHL